MRRRFWVMLVVLSFVVSLIPSTSLAYSSESEQANGYQEEEMKTIDDLFAEVAQQAPDFGGLFYDESGQLTMYLIASEGGNERMVEESQMARAAIATLWRDDPRITNAGEIRVLPAQYSFLQLKNWYDRMNTVVLGVPGVHLTDIDEVSNRLRIHIENQEARDEVEEQLAQLGVPLEAVIIEVTEPFHNADTLRDTRRPVVGGLQILYAQGLLKYRCTLGFIAVKSGTKGIVTNSHCTKTQGGVENTVYHLPTNSWTNNRIAKETIDPAYVAGGKCPAQRRCRWSDAAFAVIPHPSGPTFNALRGFIARTTGVNNNSITIDPDNPQFRITREITTAPFAGQILNKVGRTTGWTQGTVSETCINANAASSVFTLFCQYSVDARLAGGDSGSPVFALIYFSHQSTVDVNAWAGWLQTPLTLEQGDQFAIGYESGTWTVDFQNFPYVSPEGYPPEIDSQIFQGCKQDSSLPYAHLLGQVGNGQTFAVGVGDSFTADASGPLYLRINDDDTCLDDNAGWVSMTVYGPEKPNGDVGLYGIAWGSTNGDTKFVFSPMANIERSGELGSLRTCQVRYGC